jgi:hypothetical protein
VDLDAAVQAPDLLALAPAPVLVHLQMTLQAVGSVPEPDFFVFKVSAARALLGADREFLGGRFSVTADMDGRVFDTFALDCTVGDAIVPPTSQVRVGDLLAFAGLPHVHITGISAAQHLAEKLHAICRDRGGLESNRVKDLFDVVVLLEDGVAAPSVIEVLADVFRVAGDTPISRLGQPVPEAWRARYTALAEANELGVSFDEAIQRHRQLCEACAGLLRKLK